MSGIEQLGSARIALKKNQKKHNMLANVFADLAATSVWLKDRLGKATTAWGDYEKGYTSLGGEPGGMEERPTGILNVLKKPTGTVTIDNLKYDKENIIKVGAFESSIGSHPDLITSEDSWLSEIVTKYAKLVTQPEDLFDIKDEDNFTNEEIDQILEGVK